MRQFLGTFEKRALGLHLHPNTFIRFSSLLLALFTRFPYGQWTMYTVGSIELEGLPLNAT